MRSLVLLWAGISMSVLDAQAPTAAFDVASVRRNVSDAPIYKGTIAFQRGRFMATNVPLLWLISEAYGDATAMNPDRIIDGPDWIRSLPFDIVATTDGAAAVPAMRVMLQTLLVEQFGLQVRRGQREGQVYALRMDRSDGALGPRLRRDRPPECADDQAAKNPVARCDLGVFAERQGGPHTAYVVERDMREIADFLGGSPVGNLDRPLVDQTGLTGRFSFAVTFSPLAGRINAVDAGGTQFVTALKEQLGLRIESARGAVDVLYVESARQPVEP